MEMEIVRPSHKERRPRIILLTSLLFFVLLFPGSSSAQRTLDAPSSTTTTALGQSPIASGSAMTALTLTRPQNTEPTLMTVSSTRNSSTSLTGSDDNPITPDIFSNDSGDVYQERNESVFNYYFLFLAAFGVLIVAGLWWIHNRRRRRKEEMRRSGHNALARDLDGWVNTRRWMHGAWRYNQTAAFVRREEGLNEHGEAPPPYQPKSAATAVQGDVAATQDPVTGLTIPLHTLSRDEIERNRPPGYEEPYIPNNTADTRPDTATTYVTLPGTSGRHPNSSTRDLLRAQTHQSGTENVP